MRILRLLCAAAFIVSAAGCSTVYRDQNPQLPKSYRYTVNGHTYVTYATADGFHEVGTASWYGPGFHGKKTANGERFNQNALTAAHKLLPFGARIRVLNTENGRSIIVRINDRGPFIGDRIIDLSKRAASEIGMLGKGTARVILDAESNAAEASSGRNSVTLHESVYLIRLGSYGSAAQAALACGNLDEKERNEVSILHNNNAYVAQAGPYSQRQTAEEKLARLKEIFSGAEICQNK